MNALGLGSVCGQMFSSIPVVRIALPPPPSIVNAIQVKRLEQILEEVAVAKAAEEWTLVDSPHNLRKRGKRGN